jgi:hypothetical protein
MLGLKWFPLGAVCGIKTPLWFAVLKPTTVTKKKKKKERKKGRKTTFNLEGTKSTAPGVPPRQRKMLLDDVNAEELDFTHWH